MTWRWLNPENRRFYEARLERTLLGVDLVTRYGGRKRRGAHLRSYPVQTRHELRALLHQLSARRRRHGYDTLGN